MLSDTALKNVQAVLSSLDELVCGKFIFAENIIAKILVNISESDEIYELISECMKNFNFDREFNRAKVKMPTKNGYFVMPESRAVILPLVFCMFVDIRDRKINFRELLDQYFQSEEKTEYENFAETVIMPFKYALMYCFDMENQSGQVGIVDIENQQSKLQERQKKQQENQIKKQEIKEEIENKNQEYQKQDIFFRNIKIICNQILSQIECERKVKPNIKEDCIYIVGCIIDNADKQDINNISALIVVGEYVMKNIKSLRFYAKELRDQLINLYN